MVRFLSVPGYGNVFILLFNIKWFKDKLHPPSMKEPPLEQQMPALADQWFFALQLNPCYVNRNSFIVAYNS
jgi:hypothetical protein